MVRLHQHSSKLTDRQQRPNIGQWLATLNTLISDEQRATRGEDIWRSPYSRFHKVHNGICKRGLLVILSNCNKKAKV